MKTPRSNGSFACFALAGVLTFTAVGSGAARAGSAGAVTGTGAVSGAAAGVGSHAGGTVGGGGGHSAVAAPVSRGMVASAGFSNGLRGGGGNLRPMTATYSGPPRYLPGGFAPNVVSHAPSMRAGGLRYPSNTAVAQADGLVAGNVAVAHNAWSDPSTGHAANGRQNRFSGTVLYPDALPDNPASRFGGGYANGGRLPYGSGRYHLHGRGYSSFYGTPYPYLFSGGYAPYYGDANLGLGTAASDGAIGNADNATAGSNQLPTAATNDLSRPYPSEDYVVNPASNAPANPPATGASANGGVSGNTGPDSLVEAVQAELSRRGYFGGKVDSIYNDATHTAIQRFQTDQQLPATGRINEATLHALQLD